MSGLSINSQQGFQGIPNELIPLRFKLVTAKNGKVIVGLIAVYAISAAILLLSYSLAGQKITLSSGLQIAAIGGDGISVAILIFTMSVKQYSQETYISSFKERAKRIYPNVAPEVLTGMLKQFHGQLQNTTGNILKNELGATLVAISTTVGFVAAALKG
jgi:hypothetical protein